MIKKLSRAPIVILASVVVVLLLGGYGISTQWDRLTDPYFGLVTHLDVQMDDATRTLIQQRVTTTQASLDAQKDWSDTDIAQTYLVLAENQKMLGDLVASRKMYEVSLAKNESSYVAWNSYAKLLELMKDFPKAEDAYKKTITLMKDEPYYRDYVDFLTLHFPARQADIKTVLDEAYAQLKQTVWTMTALGNWNFTAGNCTEGRAHYNVAKTLAPSAAARESLAQDEEEKFAECTK